MTKLILTIIAILSTAACADTSYRYQAAPNVPECIVAIANEVADEICDATDGLRCPTFSREPAPNTLLLVDLEPNHLGKAIQHTDGEVWLLLDADTAKSDDTALIKSVLRHEIGHAVGCWRHTENGAIVTYEEDSAGEYSSEDTDCMSPEPVTTEDIAQGGV